MTRSISYCTLICAIAVAVICAIYKPELISDKNRFLFEFVNHELLGLLAIILTITLASAANLHFEFNKIEEHYQRRGLTDTRRGVRQGAYCLIALFVFSTLLVLTKPIFASSDASQAVFNGLALVALLWNVLILVELTQLAFSIQPDIKD
jgi:hypothetical protein